MPTAASTINIIEREVLSLIGENPDTPDAFSDITPIRDSINDAVEEIVMVTGSVKRDYQLPLKDSTTFYTLTVQDGGIAWITDAFMVKQQRRLNQTSLFKLNSIDPRWRLFNGTPREYFQLSYNIVGFYPIPEKIVTGKP